MPISLVYTGTDVSMASRQIKFGYEKDVPTASAPLKHADDDIGWDLALIELLNPTEKNNPRKIYSTGLRLQAPPGYFFEIVPRPNLQSKGYAMMDRTIVTPSSQSKVLTVTLTKFDDDAEPLKIPGRWIQAILVQAVVAFPALTTIAKKSSTSSKEKKIEVVVPQPQIKYAGDSDED